MKSKKANDSSPKYWAVLRILIGLVFLWAFCDKMFGLGFATCRTVDPKTKVESVQVMCGKSVIKGGSPTTGFLKFGTSGPLKEFYTGLVGNGFVDALFMTGLGLIGACLILGIGVKVAALSGVLLLMMMWSAALPGENNPVVDDHVIYSVALLGILANNNNQALGLGKWWQSKPLVKKYRILA